MTTTSSTIDPAIAAFSAAVRGELNDLPADEIDDLTDGLEADLSDQAADDDAPALGDPADYADELRSAAGLDARESAQRPPLIDLAGMRQTLASARDAASRYIHDRPALAALVAFVVSLRPLWWVIRGLALLLMTTVVAYQLSYGVGLLISAIACVLVSIQWGRGKWAPWAWVRAVRVLASVVTILLIPQLVTTAWYLAFPGYGNVEEYYPPQGLMNNDSQVTNIFAYDADGNPIVDVQLFDQDGNPLSTFSAEAFGEEYFTTSDAQGYDNLWLIRRVTASSVGGWNVYPLQTAEMDGADRFGKIGEARLPFPHADPLLKLQPVDDEVLEMSPTNVPEP
ncbi:MAG: hypothetical protein ACOH1T_08360 [Microbacteriaceae bacterium]